MAAAVKDDHGNFDDAVSIANARCFNVNDGESVVLGLEQLHGRTLWDLTASYSLDQSCLKISDHFGARNLRLVGVRNVQFGGLHRIPDLLTGVGFEIDAVPASLYKGAIIPIPRTPYV